MENLYIELGEAEGVRALVEEFYRQMDTDPSVSGIRKMHPTDLSVSIEKLYAFLSGWLGGPQLYWEKYGHPRLRMRHMPFVIGPSERDQWLHCMKAALDSRNVPLVTQEFLMDALRKVAMHMENTD